MSSLSAFALGLFAATLVLSVSTHWAALLATVLGKHGGDFLGPPKRRLLWAVPLVIVRPAPFLLAAALGGGAMAALTLLGRSCEWFFAGFYCSLGYVGLVASIAWRRSKARRAGLKSPS